MSFNLAPFRDSNRAELTVVWGQARAIGYDVPVVTLIVFVRDSGDWNRLAA